MRVLKSVSLSILILGGCCLSDKGLTTELRLMGMGELRLVVEDEANMINLYDFCGNVAGLYMDEPMSTLNGSFNYGTVTQSDSSGTVDPKVSYLGQLLPDILMSCIPDAYKIALPAGPPLGADFVYRMESSAISVRGDFAHLKATFEQTEPEQSITLDVFPSSIVQYNTLFADRFSLGLQAGYLQAKQTADPEISESTMNNFGGGLGIGLFLSEFTTLGGTFNYIKPKIEVGIDTSLDKSGFDFGVHGIFQTPGLFKAGAKFNYNSLSGDASMKMADTTSNIGSLKGSGYGLETKALTTFFLVPVQLAASFGYIRESEKFEESEEVVSVKQVDLGTFDRSISTIPIGLGVIYATPMVTTGGEFHYTTGEETDKIADTSLSSLQLSFNLGTEVNFGVAAIRGGFVMAKSDPDKVREGDEFTTKKFTLGLGLTPPGSMFKGDLAYNYITTSPDENPRKEKTATDLFSLGIKFFF